MDFASTVKLGTWYMRWFLDFSLGLFVLFVVQTGALAEKRVALVIGNGAYAHAPHLPNPPHDADDVAAALKRTGFETILGIDLDKASMDDVSIRFARAARTADVAVFYYSGHAMQYAGINYLMPVDAQLSDEADLRRMVRADDILADLQQAKNLRILVLDSCRDNPLADALKRTIGQTRSASIGRGLAKIESPDGTIISYSTQSGRTAVDGDRRNSPYTTAFLKHIADKDEIATIFHRISADVYETTGGTQVPELSLSFFGQFYLNGNVEITLPRATTSVPPDPCDAAQSHWNSADAIGTVAAYEDHITRFGNCRYAGLAKARLDQLKSNEVTVPSAAQQPSPMQQTAVEPWPMPSPGYSKWMTSGDYQTLFNDMVRNRQYPRIVEARSYNGGLLFHAVFAPFDGGHFNFWSHHGMKAELFEQRKLIYGREGFALVWKQSVVLNGVEYIQATWVRR
jgi:uncharacterized caspase-like protein